MSKSDELKSFLQHLTESMHIAQIDRKEGKMLMSAAANRSLLENIKECLNMATRVAKGVDTFVMSTGMWNTVKRELAKTGANEEKAPGSGVPSLFSIAVETFPTEADAVVRARELQMQGKAVMLLCDDQLGAFPTASNN